MCGGEEYIAIWISGPRQDVSYLPWAETSRCDKSPSSLEFFPCLPVFSSVVSALRFHHDVVCHIIKMQWTTLALAALTLIRHASSTPAPASEFELQKRQFAQAAMMRFECSQLVIERVDPLVQPGQSPSSHLHQIAGGNSFKSAMEPVSYDPPKQSTCTSCTFSEDFSNYWTANLYFKARNGTFKRVPQMTNLGLRGKNGGLTVYYIPPYDGKTKVTAFKPVGIPQISLLSFSRRGQDE